MPLAMRRTRTSPSRGPSISRVSIDRGPPLRRRTAARIVRACSSPLAAFRVTIAPLLIRCRLHGGFRSRGLEIGFDVDDDVEMFSDHELVFPEHVVPGDPEILPVQGDSRFEANR